MQEEHLLATIEIEEMMVEVIQEAMTSQDTINMMKEVKKIVELKMRENLIKTKVMKRNIKE